MTHVLLIANSVPPLGVLADSVRKFRERGARVYLAGTFDMAKHEDALRELPLNGFHQLPRRSSVRSAASRRRLEKAAPGLRVWLYCHRDTWLRRHSRDAGILVALDQHTVYTVWRLAQYNRAADARFGIAPALKALEDRQSGVSQNDRRRLTDTLPSPGVLARDVQRATREMPNAVIRAVTSRPVMRSAVGARLWRAAVAAPGIPETLRAKTARHVADGMAWANRPGGAALALTDAARRVTDDSLRANLLSDAARAELKKGRTPNGLHDAVASLMSLADEHHRSGDSAGAAASLHRALGLAFHRVLHIDRLTSPLATEAEEFLAPLRDSAALEEVGRPRGRLAAASPVPSSRPLRLLIMTSSNDNFLPLIRSRYEAHPGVEARFLDVAADPYLKRLTQPGVAMLEHRLSGDAAYAEELEQYLRPHLDWADTVFLDWCVSPAAMLTSIDPGTTRIVVRLHSYETFTHWPHAVDFSRVDDLLFVAEHVKDLTMSLVPQLMGEDAPRMRVLHNAMDLSGFVRAKNPDARFNIGLIGIGQVAKDPLWAVDVLRRVREHDDRYRLLLVGDEMQPKASQATRDYLKAFRKELAPLVESGAVVLHGRTEDVPATLTGIGTILSSSVREGCHVGLMEGAASAAVPVVRDWPFYAGKRNSARTLYPGEWVVGSPEEAAERILRTTGSEDRWLAAGKDASEHALTTWDWSVVRHDFDQLFLGDKAARP